MATEVEVYFPYTLNFDIGSQPVRLYGAILASDRELSFALSNSIVFNPYLFPADEVTKSIREPFGMTGIVLEDLGIEGRIYKDRGNNGKAATDITLKAAARFPNLENFSLSGTIVFQQTSPRLVLVSLSADEPLTLTRFVTSVIGGAWDWADDITNEFAFQNGEMYYLNPPDGSLDNYTFPYPNPNAKQYSPGYHLEANLLIFQKYNFLIGLDVEGKAIVLHTTILKKIDFDFITLDNPNLKISTKSPDKYLQVSTTLTILNTSIKSSISAVYDLTKKAFFGEVSVNLGSLSLPTDSGSTSQNVQLFIEFTWTKSSGSNSGFKITKIDGLPTNTLNLIDKYLKVFNELRSQGCEKILSDWLNGLTNTSLTPGLNGSPSKTEDGKMKLPLKLTYKIEGLGLSESSEIDFEAVFAIPRSLDDLPRAMWQSIVDSSGKIAEDILANPDTYEVVFIEIGIRGGAKAFARVICRALEEGLEAMAKALASAAAGVVAKTLADAAALAGMLMAVSLLGVKADNSLLEAIWDQIKSGFSGDDSEKEKAEKKIREIRSQVESTISEVDNHINDIRGKINIKILNITLNTQKQFLAVVIWNLGDDKELESGSKLSCKFRLLSGEAGDTQGRILSEAEKQLFPVVKNWAEIPNNSEYRMNASVKSILSGFTFMNQQTEDSMTSAIGQLQGIDNGVARDFANYLQKKLDEFRSYNTNGIQSDWVYAKSDIPSYSTVGKTYIGINSRISISQNS
jgi:hypothetical protein